VDLHAVSAELPRWQYRRILLLQHGPFGIEGVAARSPVRRRSAAAAARVLWSLSLNLLTYVALSLARQPSSIERVQADLFVPNALAPDDAPIQRWRTTVTVQDIQTTVAQYLGPDRARHSFEAFAANRHAVLERRRPADFELLQHASI